MPRRAYILSYELRPGGTRPGPAELWSTVDATVQELGMAMVEHSVPAEQHALEQLSLVLQEIVDALVEGYGDPVAEEPGDDDESGDEPADAAA